MVQKRHPVFQTHRHAHPVVDVQDPVKVGPEVEVHDLRADREMLVPLNEVPHRVARHISAAVAEEFGTVDLGIGEDRGDVPG